jgi:HEAT repeat protein
MDSSSRPALLFLSQSKDADHRWWAVCALSESPHVRADDLLPFLQDASAEVRQAALLGLCAHPDEQAVPALIEALKDEDRMAAGLAVNALVRVGQPAVPALILATDHSSLHVRVLALKALAAIPDHRAIPAMMKAVQEDSALLRYWASRGLERLGLDMVYIKP